jgi:hypothetical protein
MAFLDKSEMTQEYLGICRKFRYCTLRSDELASELGHLRFYQFYKKHKIKSLLNELTIRSRRYSNLMDLY